MKIAVIGAGAMGSIYASFLAQSNNDVLAIDLWEDHIKAINTNGLRVSGFSGDKTVKNIKVSKDIKHICLGISASGPTKRWHIKNFIKLCVQINEKKPSKFYQMLFKC